MTTGIAAMSRTAAIAALVITSCFVQCRASGAPSSTGIARLEQRTLLGGRLSMLVPADGNSVDPCAPLFEGIEAGVPSLLFRADDESLEIRAVELQAGPPDPGLHCVSGESELLLSMKTTWEMGFDFVRHFDADIKVHRGHIAWLADTITTKHQKETRRFMLAQFVDRRMYLVDISFDCNRGPLYVAAARAMIESIEIVKS